MFDATMREKPYLGVQTKSSEPRRENIDILCTKREIGNSSKDPRVPHSTSTVPRGESAST